MARLPKQAPKHLEKGRELLKEAKGLKQGRRWDAGAPAFQGRGRCAHGRAYDHGANTKGQGSLTNWMLPTSF
jgi:hypothetical protein